MEINLKNGSLVWLRRDLRLDDNNAISKAISLKRNFAICFVFDKTILNPLLSEPLANKDSNHFVIDNRISFIYDSLKELDENLKKMGSRLIVKHGFSTLVIPELVKKLQVENLICSNDYEPLAISRDAEIKKIIKNNQVNFISVKDQCIFEKTEILTKTGNPYTVFTPYKKTWFEKFFSDYSIDLYEKKMDLSKNLLPVLNNNYFPFPKLEEMGFSNKGLLSLSIKTGNSGAMIYLNEFLNKINFYKSRRDFPAVAGTSHLSVHLRFGTVSIRELVNKALNKHTNLQNLSEGSQAWLSELVWREFYMQILFNFPYVTSGCFKKNYDQIKWASSKSLFDSWSKGFTGYPIIDAGMRQLNETGFMHNRLRMLTASFLTKDLGINWQEGEKYFALKLNDFDLSANNGGWQWAASTGCDAQPYFRIFNPITQSKKFDPEGEYIKRYIPELKNLDSKYIHTPWLAPNDILIKAGIKIGHDYPGPEIDHNSARLITLNRYEAARSRS
jgi:deoxyribodipyrimidine photo-lyase